jgi:hypothetical protein
MSDEGKWTDHDDVMVHLASLTPAHPTYVGTRFFAALVADPVNLTYLGAHVTPESRPKWGDFSDASGFVRDLSNPGVLSIVRGYPHAMDVAWIVVIEQSDGRWHDGLPAEKDAIAYLTMVKRPSLGGWLVHHLGDELPLKDVPRELVDTRAEPQPRTAEKRPLRDRLRFRRP